MFLVNGTVDPAGSVIVPAIKSRKTAPLAMPVISVPAGFVPLIPVVNNEPIVIHPTDYRLK